MTDKEKATVMAYTGVCMLSGDKFNIFHEYVENIMGRPVYTHEMAIEAVVDEIKEKAKTDFIELCAEQEPKTGHWEQYGYSWENKFKCSECGNEQPKILCDKQIIGHWSDFCPNCGARMESEEV